MIAALVTTYNRAHALRRSLPQVAALGWPVLVVDDGSGDDHYSQVVEVAAQCGALLLSMPANRGLACALNAGLAYWLADPAVRAVSYFQDDVDVRPDAGAVLEALTAERFEIVTGHDAGEHPPAGRMEVLGRECVLKANCRATHLHATRDYWLGVMPIPTRKLGAPCREPGQDRGTGSNVDWWVVRDAPQSIVRRGAKVLCAPGLVRTFLWRAEDSCWDNTQRAGADPEWT